jgi:polar amino acid transport system substrate-binding protein
MPPLDIAAETIAALAPSGVLRAAINLGNPILATADANTGAAGGVSIDLAGELAQRLGVPLQLLLFGTAGHSVDAVSSERADIGFFAVDPARGAGIAFTAPYLLIEGCYLVRESSPLQDNDDVDQDGVHVVVGADSAYDLFLTRTLQHAQIVRAPSSPAVVATFVEQGLDVAAGVKQQLQTDARSFPGHRLLSRPLHGHPAGDGSAQKPWRRCARAADEFRGRHEVPGLCGRIARPPRRARCFAGTARLKAMTARPAGLSVSPGSSQRDAGNPVPPAFRARLDALLGIELAQPLQFANNRQRETFAASTAVDQQVLQQLLAQRAVTPTPRDAVGHAGEIDAQAQWSAPRRKAPQPLTGGTGDGAVALAGRAA